MSLNKLCQSKYYSPSLLSAVEAVYGCRLSNSGDRMAPAGQSTMKNRRNHRISRSLASSSPGAHAAKYLSEEDE